MGSYVMSAGAAACFTCGGLLMKPSAGLRHIAPTFGVFALFVVGTILLARTVQHADEVGAPYLIVTGLETTLAFFLGVLLFGEAIDPLRLGAVVMIVAGTLVLA